METAGKKKCELLKKMRMQIALENGIEYSPTMCNHQGDCQGTCPACDAELQYLQSEIDKKHGTRRHRSYAASAVGALLTTAILASCHGKTNPGESEVTFTVVDSSMVGTEHQIDYCEVKKDSSLEPVTIMITSDMIGECIQAPDSGGALWKAIEEKKKKSKARWIHM